MKNHHIRTQRYTSRDFHDVVVVILMWAFTFILGLKRIILMTSSAGEASSKLPTVNYWRSVSLFLLILPLFFVRVGMQSSNWSSDSWEVYHGNERWVHFLCQWLQSYFLVGRKKCILWVTFYILVIALFLESSKLEVAIGAEVTTNQLENEAEQSHFMLKKL